MEQISLRIYMILGMLIWQLQMWAQDDEEDFFEGGRRASAVGDSSGMEGLMDYQPIHFRFSDILIVICVVVSIFVFRKIWKGCSYMIILLAALYYFCVR